MGPIDYSGAFAEGTPQQALLGGLQVGSAMQDMMAKRAAAEAKAKQQEQMQQDFNDLYDDPTPERIARTTLKYPQMSEHFKRSYDMLEPAERQNNLERLVPIGAAIQNNRMDVAEKLMLEQAAGLRNAGKEREAKGAEAMLEVFKKDPKLAKITIGQMIAATAGPEKYAAAMAAQGAEGRAAAEAPADLAKKQAEAIKADAEAQVAQGTVPAMIQKPVEENLTAANNRKLADFNAQIAGANSETQRGQLILERDKWAATQGIKTTEAGEAAQTQIDSAQQAISTITALRNHPLMKASVSNYVAGIGSVLGSILGNVPGTENKDFRSQLGSLKAQVFLPAVQQLKAAGGGGALSDAEGKKLDAAIAALDAEMSQQSLYNNLGVIERYMSKMTQKALSTKAAPTQGGGFVMNHPTFGPIREGDINRLMKQNPGATRQQVLDYLNRPTGGASGDWNGQ